MGLLDDAIREHLELKRLRGADPGEVAREQREALDPVPRDDEIAGEDHAAASGEATVAVAGETMSAGAMLPEDPPGESAQPARGPDFSNIGQETAELDMRSVLDEDHGAPTESDDASTVRPVAVGPAGGAPPEEHRDEDSLEWEVPGDSGDFAGDAGGHDRAAGDDSIAAGPGEQEDATGSAEDVLEETPDFLRDTPEQERLWFEQRPPRDFDFDK